MSFQFNNAVMALDAGRLFESIRLHRILPKVIRVVMKLVFPSVCLVRVIRRVFGVSERRSRTLPVMT